MRIATPSTLWETSSKSESIIIQHKIYFRIVNTLATAIATDLASPNHWQEVTSYISELPSIKTGIEYELGQFKSDNISLTLNDISYFQTTFFDVVTSSQFIEVKIISNLSNNGSTFTSDNCVLFSGSIDVDVLNYDEATDTISCNVYSLDDNADKLQATTSMYDSGGRTISVSGTDYSTKSLRLIAGVYVYVCRFRDNENHEVTYSVSGATHTLKLDDYSTTITATGSTAAFYTLGVDDNFATFVVLPNELIGYGEHKQNIYVTSALTSTTPRKHLCDTNVFTMLNTLFIGANITPTFTKYNLPVINTSTLASGYSLNYLEVADDGGRGAYVSTATGMKPQAICFNSSDSKYYYSIGDRLFKRGHTENTNDILLVSATTGSFTNLNGYIIKRLWYSNYGGVVGIARNSSGTYKGFFYSNAGTLTQTTLTRGGADSETLGYKNFAFLDVIAPKPPAVYYCTDVTTAQPYSIRFYNVQTNTDDYSGKYYDYLLTDVHPVYNSAAGTDNELTYYPYAYNTGTGDYFFSNYDRDTNTFIEEHSGNIAGVSYLNDCVYSEAEVKIYATDSSNELFHWGLNNGGSETYPLSGSLKYLAHGLTYSSDVYFYGAVRNLIQFGKINSSGVISGYGISNAADLRGLLDTNEIPKMNQIVFNPVKSCLFGFLPKKETLWQFCATTPMNINAEFDVTNMSVREAINKICIAYNLVYAINPNKTTYVFRRGNDSGTILNSYINTSVTDYLDLSERDVSEFKATKKGYAKFQIVSIKNDFAEVLYDGTTFGAIQTSNQRILKVDSNLIQTNTLYEMAYYFYQFYKNNYNIYSMKVLKPKYQYETLDGVALSSFNRNILAVSTSAGAFTMLSQSINNDGTMDIALIGANL